MSDYYFKIGEISQETRAEIIVICRGLDHDWQPSVGEKRNYTANMEGKAALQKITELTDRWPVDIWQSAFFLNIPPGGQVHKHVDEAHPWNTYHIVLLTNDQCINRVWEGEREHDFRLQPNGIYRIDRSIPHESFNHGETERIHLLMEVHEGKFDPGPQ
jgi:aspartyl/asparaginyl beta-hydroxylase (cupin superfamily)